MPTVVLVIIKDVWMEHAHKSHTRIRNYMDRSRSQIMICYEAS